VDGCDGARAAKTDLASEGEGCPTGLTACLFFTLLHVFVRGGGGGGVCENLRTHCRGRISLYEALISLSDERRCRESKNKKNGTHRRKGWFQNESKHFRLYKINFVLGRVVEIPVPRQGS
jgi:hypothetical protein